MSITKRISDSITENTSKRITEAPEVVATSRIHFLLLLEGDAQDNGDVLLLEGDAQTGNDALKLGGDAATITASHTKRVAATP